MKYILLLFTTILSLNASGQSAEQTTKISIGFTFSPDYSFRTLKSNDDNSTTRQVIKDRNHIEIAKFGFSTGLNITYHLSNHIGLETGVQYANKGYKAKETDLILEHPDPNMLKKASINYSYQYLGIPIIARFTFGKSKIRFTSGAGIATNFLIKTKNTAHYKYADGKTEKRTETHSSDFKKVSFSPLVSLGIDYKISDKIHVSAEPTFRFGHILNESGPIKVKLWSTGLALGVACQLK